MALPPCDVRAAPYLPRTPFDSTWNELAARHASGLEALPAVNPGARTLRRDGSAALELEAAAEVEFPEHTGVRGE